MYIAWRLAEVLAQRGMTPLELARALGVKHPSVYRLAAETRFSRITGDKLLALCTTLRCQPGDLIRVVHDDGTPVATAARKPKR